MGETGEKVTFAFGTLSEALGFLKSLKGRHRDERGRFISVPVAVLPIAHATRDVLERQDPRDYADWEVPPIYKLNEDVIASLAEAEKRDTQAVSEIVEPGSTMFQDSFEVINKVTRDLEQRARAKEEGYSHDEASASKMSLMAEKRRLIEAWKAWGPDHGFIPPLPTSEEYTHYLSSEEHEFWFLSQERNRDEGGSDLDHFIGSVLANTSFDADVGSGEITRVEDTWTQLDDIRWDKVEIAKILSQVPYGQLAVPTWSTPECYPFPLVSDDQGIHLARAPISEEKPGIQMLGGSVNQTKIWFNESTWEINDPPGIATESQPFEGDKVVFEPLYGDPKWVDEETKDSLIDMFRRWAYQYEDVTVQLPEKDRKYGANISTMRSVLRFPDTQRLIPVKGSLRIPKPVQAPESAKNTVIARFNPRYYWCERCAQRAMDDPQFRDRLYSMKSVNIFGAKGRIFCHTPHVLDICDYRAYQAAMLFGASFKDVYDNRLWQESTAWQIRGNSGDWRCLLCGGSVSMSVDYQAITRIGYPKWGYWDRTERKWMARPYKGFWPFTSALVVYVNVRVRGEAFLKQLKKARPEDWAKLADTKVSRVI